MSINKNQVSLSLCVLIACICISTSWIIITEENLYPKHTISLFCHSFIGSAQSKKKRLFTFTQKKGTLPLHPNYIHQHHNHPLFFILSFSYLPIKKSSPLSSFSFPLTLSSPFRSHQNPSTYYHNALSFPPLFLLDQGITKLFFLECHTFL